MTVRESYVPLAYDIMTDMDRIIIMTRSLVFDICIKEALNNIF